MKLIYSILAITLLGSTINIAQATILYSTDFESPTFSVGSIAGQGGWNASGASGTIQTSIVGSGSQALQVSPGQTALAPFGGFSVGSNLLRIEFDMRRSGANGQAALSISGDGTPKFVGQLMTNPSAVAIGNTNSSIPWQSFTNDIFHQVAYELNFSNLTMEGFVDGVSIGTLAINNTVLPSNINYIYFYSFSNTDATLYIDNLRISEATVPEPGSLALLGIGLLGLVAARVRKGKVKPHINEIP